MPPPYAEFLWLAADADSAEAEAALDSLAARTVERGGRWRTTEVGRFPRGLLARLSSDFNSLLWSPSATYRLFDSPYSDAGHLGVLDVYPGSGDEADLLWRQ